ncbi:MAG: peptidyl-prolyl cis-trans isomerase [Deltaproteobacteria bacterium]|nr:peptidyl-prolyl cis-trans isomerase [Deltaproteobacteria bacterium]
MQERRETAAIRVWRAHPLVRFAVLGAALFALDRWRTTTRTPAASGRDIVLSRDFVAGLRAGLWRERGREPGQAEFEARLAEHVRDEVLYRSALARGLDRGDGIIRRRLVQKETYLLEAEAEPGPPSEAALRSWYEAHRERYRTSSRIDLEHRFFSVDRRGARASADAARSLSSGAPGDPFLRGERFEAVTSAELAGVFGEAFAAAVEALPVGPWSGPVASALGQHLVRVGSRREGAVAPFEEARESVAREWREAERTRRVEAATRALLGGYRVVRE